MMLGRKATNLVKGCAISADLPQPSLLNDVLTVVEEPDKAVPFIVRWASLLFHPFANKVLETVALVAHQDQEPVGLGREPEVGNPAR
jgi:hypothetical protein